MDAERKIVVTVIVSTIIFSIICIFCLPESVRVMKEMHTDDITYLPKMIAISLAAIMNILGIGLMKVSKKEEPRKYHYLMISVLGTFLFIYMIFANCISPYL